ncbi:hypothetical protein JCM19294_551 [Nonlabens tegetincola]|uniref:Outer membrane lipoprotein carrier protein LolA n=2 Tax=Nonlabens tegetincola TaxID=323273 RepID=A0A090Q223_9FLAO|nr:hypothetical protein JCM19294_551 [Nonlabens tegetincola]
MKKRTPKMKHIITAVFMIFAFAKAVTAQDAKAEKLLDEVTAKFQSYENISFLYKGNLRNAKSKTNMDIQGSARMSGEKYNVGYLGTTIIFDGTKQYVINSEDEQVTVSTLDDDNAQSITPSNMLSFYNKGYNKKMDIVKNVGGRKIQFVKLTPIKSDSNYKSVLIGIDSNTKHINEVIVTEKNGTVITFTIKSLKVNEPCLRILLYLIKKNTAATT